MERLFFDQLGRSSYTADLSIAKELTRKAVPAGSSLSYRNNREACFVSAEDYQYHLELWAACAKDILKAHVTAAILSAD